MKNLKQLLFFIILAVTRFRSTAQTDPTDANAKTDVSLQGTGKMGDLYDVNLYDGSVSVNVPIYNYKIDGLDLSVALSYDARGVKVNQAASSVGLNWSLMAGAYIERTVKGCPDEGHPVSLIYHMHAGVPHTNPCYDDGPLEPNTMGKWVFDYGNTPITRDKEDDVFSVNLGGSAFRMMIHDISYDGSMQLEKVVTYPKREVKVQVFHNGGLLGKNGAYEGLDEQNPNDYITFVIIDEKGNKFYFSPGDVRKDYHTAPNALNPYYRYRTQRWVVTKIETITGNVITFQYRKFDNISYAYYKDQQVQERWEHSEVIDNASQPFSDTVKIESDSIVNWTGWVSHVSRIEYPNGTSVIFNFEDDPNHQRCDLNGKDIIKSISIQNKLDNVYTVNTKTYRFNYAYFHSPIIGNSNTEISYASSCDDIRQTFGLLPGQAMNHQLYGLRLKLKGIDLIGFDNATNTPYYNFEYNSTPLPERLSPSQDYFGFYNGKTPQFSSNGVSNPINLSNFAVPYHTYTYTNGNTISYGVDKSPDLNFAGACNLKKIKNNLGGEVEFYFKDHVLYNPTNSYSNNNNPLPTDYEGSNANDGLCIDKIVFRDGYNVDNTTTTKYEFDDGQRFARGGYCWSLGWGSTDVNTNMPINVGRKFYYNEFVTPLPTIGGSNHGYTYATVKNYGYNGEFLGSMKYKFSNLIDGSGTSNLKMKLAANTHQHHPEYFYDYKMGLLLETSNYSPNGDLLAKTTNTYAPNPGIVNHAVTYPSSRTTYDCTPAVDNYKEFYSIKMGKQSTTTATFIGQNSLTNTISYNYDRYDNVTSINWTDADGNVNTKKFNYNYTLINGQPMIDSLIFSTDRQYLLATEVWKNIAGADYILSYNSATPPGGGHKSNNFRSLKTSQPVTSAQYSSSAFSSTMVTNDKVHSFDDKANVIETNYEDNTYFASIWDTRIGERIADATNAQYSQIAYTSFEGAYGSVGTFEYSKGNWDFNPTGIIYSFTNGLVRPLTGRYHYVLTGSNPITSFNTLQAGVNYIVTFWATSAPSIQCGSQSFTPQQIGQKQYWKLYSVTIPGNGNQVTISSTGTSVNLDELRMHPSAAKMTTATYEPLTGVSSENDVRNNITYYEYDALGNVKVIRDANGNITSLTKQVIQGTDN
jgi:YD repeat-containing protein